MKARQRRKPERKAAERAREKEKVDELGVTRGQNAEKGNTTRPETIRNEGYVAH